MAAQFRWENIPSVIFVEILSYLSLTDRLKASSVCKRWRSCLFHPSLWRSIEFNINYEGRKRAKLLSKNCGRFVREASVAFTSTSFVDVRDTVRLLKALTVNPNLESLTLRPSSCHVLWPDREPGICRQQFVAAIEEIISNSRRLRHLSFGCMSELTDRCERILNLLRDHQFSSLQSLHISSVKEDPDSYRLLELPASTFSHLHNLSELGLDYDHLSNKLLCGLIHHGKTSLHTLIVHVHGIDPHHETITNDTWQHLVAANPNLEVTLNLIHSLDGGNDMLAILKPAMPLAHLRQFFCEVISVAAINFISLHMASRLRSVVIIDGMEGGLPNIYLPDGDEDPFVMLAWKTPNLQQLTLIGYELMQEDLIAIARLRGRNLHQFDIPLSCIAAVEGDENNSQLIYGQAEAEFCQEISENLGWEWWPMADENLHPAILDSCADAETVYLSTLQQDQTSH